MFRLFLFTALYLTVCSHTAHPQSWTALQVPNNNNLYGCWFDPAHPDSGMAVGWYLQSFQRQPFGFFTTDAGATIVAASLFYPDFYEASDVWFTNGNNGVVVGNGIIHTSDAGITWNVAADASIMQNGTLCKVMFTDSVNGYAVGRRDDSTQTHAEGFLFRTTNGGAGWSAQLITSQLLYQNTACRAVWATNNGVVFVGTENQSGGSTLFKSTDDGNTWNELAFFTGISDIYFVSPDSGFAACDDGLYLTTDSGSNWTQIISSGFGFRDLEIKSNLGFAVGEDGLIYQSTDAGATWTAMLSPVNEVIHDVCIVDSTLAYAAGSSGIFLKYSQTPVGQTPLKRDKEWFHVDNASRLHINFSLSEQKEVKIQLYGPAGVLAKETGGVPGKDFTIELGDLPSAMYLLYMESGDTFFTGKFVLP